jgi:CBS domain containing-hemolysin-like protein
MLHRVFGFGDLTAGQVMLPRTEMIALPVRVARADLLARLAQVTQLVIPVYGAHLDDIVGQVRMRDLLGVVAGSPENVDLTPMLHDPLTVPETLKADDLLTDMRRHRTPLAIVIDEYGGTAGMVTFERLMERIVGEIGAADGSGTAAITVLTDGSALIDGLALTTDVNVQFALEIDEDLYDTIGGYVLGRLGRRPKLGDTVDVGGRRIRVEALDGLRVARVRLSKPS